MTVRTTWRWRDPETGVYQPMNEYPYDEGPDAMDLAKIARAKAEANAARSLMLARRSIEDASRDLTLALRLPVFTPRDRLDRQARVFRALSRRAYWELQAHDLAEPEGVI